MLYIYLLLGVIYLSSSKTQENGQFQEFIEYTKKYNKNYSDKNEFKSRFNKWKKNYNQIKRDNPSSFSSSNKVVGAKFALNQFADMTEEEFASKYLTYDPEIYRDLATVSAEDLGLDEVEAPDEFDWVKDRNISTEIKHQKDCGGCWAFATAATLEAQYLMKYGKNISLSEQQLIDCDEKNNKCKGGNMRKAFLYLQDHGLMLSQDYPFINGVGECKYDESKTYVKVKTYNFVAKDEEAMRKVLYKYGPLAGAINGMAMMFYDEGIYEPWFSDLCPNNINHAIVIVGYGIDKETGKKFWKIKNSWGPSWGEQGYFRMIRGEGACGIDRYTLIAELERLK